MLCCVLLLNHVVKPISCDIIPVRSKPVTDFKKLRRAEGGAKIVGVFRVKNHDFTPKKSYFSNFRGGARNFWGISCEKSRFYAKKIIFFFNFRGGARAGCAPSLNPPLGLVRAYLRPLLFTS